MLVGLILKMNTFIGEVLKPTWWAHWYQKWWWKTVPYDWWPSPQILDTGPKMGHGAPKNTAIRWWNASDFGTNQNVTGVWCVGETHIYIYILLRTVSAWLHLFLGVSVARLPSAAIVSWPCAGVSQPTCAGYLRMISHGIKVLELSNVVSYHDSIPTCFWQLACFSSP